MPYGLIVVIAVLALAGVYIFAAEASWWSKALVAALLVFSFYWRYGMFLQAGLAVCLSLYFTYLKARSQT